MDALTLILTLNENAEQKRNRLQDAIKGKMEERSLYDKQLREVQFKILTIDQEINQLKEDFLKTIVIKFREEIRQCLGEYDQDYILLTHKDIISCIEYRNKIEANRNIRNKIISTLSLMYREG